MKKEKRKKKAQAQKIALIGGIVVVALCIVIAGIGSMSENTPEQQGASSGSSISEVNETSTSDENATVDEERESDIGTQENPLTLQNCSDFEYIVNYNGDDIQPYIEFSKQYYGQIVQFDGYVAYSMPSSDRSGKRYKYHDDLLIYYGDYVDADHVSSGPAFKTKHVNGQDFGVGSGEAPVSIGDNVRVLARIGEYDDTQMIFPLDQLSFELR